MDHHGLGAPDRLLLADLNYAESNREFSRRSSGAAHDEDGLLLYAGGHPLPVLTNGAMRLDARLSPSDAIDRARAFFAARKRGFTWIVRTHADADLEEVLVAAGVPLFGEPPGMVIDERIADAASPAGISLRLVTTPAEVADFAAVSGEAYATYGMPEGVAPAIFARPDALIAPHIRAYVAYEGATPLGAAMMLLSHGVGGVYWVGTRPCARGRGLAELCTRAATNAGFDLGARFVTLQASVMGEPIYKRMGYVEVTRYRSYVEFHPPNAR